MTKEYLEGFTGMFYHPEAQERQIGTIYNSIGPSPMVRFEDDKYFDLKYCEKAEISFPNDNY